MGGGEREEEGHQLERASSHEEEALRFYLTWWRGYEYNDKYTPVVKGCCTWPR